MKKKIKTLMGSLLLCGTMILTACSSGANTDEGKEDFNYYTADELKKAIENEDDMIMVDIQPEEDYEAHHIKGVVPTYAYPVDSDELKAKLDEALPELEESEEPIIIVCPGGGSGAKKTVKHYIEKGIDEARLYILEKGQKGWTYDELLEK